MTICYVLLISVACAVWLHAVAIPKLETSIRRGIDLAAVWKLSLLGVLGTLKTICILAAMASITCIAFLWSLRWYGGGTAAQVAHAIESIQRCRVAVRAISPTWSAVVLALLTAILCILAYRSRRSGARQVWEREFSDELRRLEAEREQGKLEDLPSTPAMQQIEKQIDETARRITALSDSPESENEMRALMVLMARLVSMHNALDLYRRVRPIRIDPDNQLVMPKNWRQRLAVLFFSEGTVRSLQGSRRVVYVSGLFLLVGSLLGLQASAAERRIDSRIVELRDVYLAASVSESRATLQAATNLGLPPSTTDDEEDIMSAVADVFEEEFTHQGCNDNTSSSPCPMETSVSISRNSAIRKAILESTASTSRGRIELHKSLADAEGLTPIQREALSRYEATAHSGAAVKRRATDRLRSIKQHQPALWETIKRATKTRMDEFQRPARTNSVGRAVMSEVFGLSLDPGIGTDTAFNRLAHGFQELYGSRRLESTLSFQLDAFLAGIAQDHTVDDAVRNAFAPDRIRVALGRDPFADIGARIKEDAPPGLSEDAAPGLAERARDREAAARAAVEVKELQDGARLTGERRISAAESLQGFETVFPSGARSASDTAFARVSDVTDEAQPVHSRPRRHGLDNGRNAVSGPSDPGSPPQPPKGGGIDHAPHSSNGISPPVFGGGANGHTAPSSGGFRTSSAGRINFARARSFSALRGFSRIGGVLIGRSPESNGSAPRVRDMVWEDQGTNLSFRISLHDGTVLRRGPFRKSIVSQALAYAADGRPVTVTMITAQPLSELHILSHPALVDTPLGCRAIELDRFVDTFTAQTSKSATLRANAEKLVSHHAALYNRAWAVRLMAGISAIDKSTLQSELPELAKELATTIPNALLKALRAQNFKDLSGTIAALQDKSLSPLTVKREFFDSALVQDMSNCADSGSEEAFDGCVRRRVGNVDASMLRSWLILPPEFTVWSGVRERDFKLDTELSFLNPPPELPGSPGGWPLEFMLQVSFVSPPGFLESRDSETYNDIAPWEFPAIKDHIVNEVSRGIEKSPLASAVLRDLWEFTVLQRFFRLALDDQLGRTFPMARLVALARSTGESVAESRTPRWNPRSGMLEMLLLRSLLAYSGRQVVAQEKGVKTTDRAWSDRVQATIPTCSQSMKDVIDRNQSLAELSDDMWSQRCNFVELGESMPEGIRAASLFDENVSRGMLQLRAVVEQGVEVSHARRIRRELGVHEDELLKRGPFECPPL